MSNRHRGMSDKVARSLGFSGREPRYGEEMAPCPRCGTNLEIGTSPIGQTVEKCPECNYQKLHRGRLTTD